MNYNVNYNDVDIIYKINENTNPTSNYYETTTNL